LLYNPDSGGSKKRQKELQTALDILKSVGKEAYLILTDSREHAAEETRRAIACGCDTVFACGGDGTINNLAQVLAGSETALGLFPMGTANALAHDLGLPLDIAAAAKAALTAKRQRVAMGSIACAGLDGQPVNRCFIVAAGVGVDAHLFYKLHTGSKQNMGMMAYYAKALNLCFTYTMRRFVGEYLETGVPEAQKSNLTEMMAVRIRHFGNVVREFAPGASLERNDMRLILCRTDSRLKYLAYVARCLVGGAWQIPGIDLVHSPRIRCDYPCAAGSQPRKNIYVEADGELIGMLPAELSVVPDALTLLAPAR
jgi:diacylglycerol kinase family enzyme